MKTHTIELESFTFEELSESAKERAMHDFGANAYWVCDNVSDCLNERFVEPLSKAGFEIAGQDIGWENPNHGINVQLEADYLYEKGALKHIAESFGKDSVLYTAFNNLQDVQRRNFYDLTASVKLNHGYESYSEVRHVERNYGEALVSQKTFDQVEGAIQDILYAIEQHIRIDLEWHYSEEYFAEHCEANDIEFLENGEVFPYHYKRAA